MSFVALFIVLLVLICLFPNLILLCVGLAASFLLLGLFFWPIIIVIRSLS